MKKQQLIEEFEGEEYLHKETWRVVNRQFDRPADSKKGAMYDNLVAMVFALYTLEGYLNFIGDRIMPEVWKNERETFSKGGITGKLEAVLNKCGVDPLEKGRRPYSTVQTLKKLRDCIAHPKTQKPRGSTVYSEGNEPPMFHKTYLETLISRQKAERARDDVWKIVKCIHAAAVEKFSQLHLGDDGLEGIISMHSRSVKLHQIAGIDYT